VTKGFVAPLEFRVLQHPHRKVERERREHLGRCGRVHPAQGLGHVGFVRGRQGPG
jgi:hypothetical protein